MSNLRAFPNGKGRSDLDHEVDHQATEQPDTAKLQRLLGEMIESTVSAFQKPSRDRELRIRNFRSERFRLTDDLILVLEDRGDQYIASSYDTSQYGIGCSPESAIQDLCSVLEDYYNLLVEDAGHLSAPLEAHRRYLESILQEIE